MPKIHEMDPMRKMLQETVNWDIQNSIFLYLIFIINTIQRDSDGTGNPLKFVLDAVNNLSHMRWELHNNYLKQFRVHLFTL